MFGDITACQIHPCDRMGKRKTLIHGYNMRHAISTIQDNPGRSSRGVQTQHSLGRDEQRRSIEGFKKYFGCLLTIGLWIQWSFGQQNLVRCVGGGLEHVNTSQPASRRRTYRMLFTVDIQLFFAVNMGPNSFHISPICDNAMFHRITQLE